MKKRFLGIVLVVLIMTCGLVACVEDPSQAKSFDVVFNMNGVENVVDAPDSQIVKGGDKVIKPTIEPKADEKVFLDWSVDAIGEVAFSFDTEIAKDTIIYAKWRDKYSYTVSFEGNGVVATNMPTVQGVAEGRKAIFPSGTPKADGKIFVGWYNDVACENRVDFNLVIVENTTFYAEWVDASDYLNDPDFIEYNKFRGNDGISDAKAPISADDIELKWKLKLSNGWTSTGWPIEIGDYIFITSAMGGNKLNKISKETGEIVASQSMVAGVGFFSSIACGDGKIFVPLNDGIIQTFDAETLVPLWTSKIPTDKDGADITSLQALSAIVYHDGYIYMGVADASAKKGAFFCLSTADDNTEMENEVKDFTWIYNPQDRKAEAAAGFYWSVGAVVGDYIVFGGEEGVLYSHHLTANTVDDNGVTVFNDIFQLEGASEAMRCAVLYDAFTERVFVNTKAGNVHGIKIDKNGKFVTESYKKTFISANITSSPTVYRGRLYVGGGGISSRAPFTVMDAESLEIIYQVNITSQSSPMITTAYATAENNYKVYIYLLEYSNKDGIYILEDWQGKTAADEKITFIPSPDKQYNTSSVMIGKEGNLYYRNDSGWLFAFGTISDNKYTSGDVINAINNLPNESDFDLLYKNNALQAYYRYNMLSADEKLKVTNIENLDNIMIKLDVLLKK